MWLGLLENGVKQRKKHQILQDPLHSQNYWLLEPTPLPSTVKMSPAANEKAVKSQRGKWDHFRYSQFKAVYCFSRKKLTPKSPTFQFKMLNSQSTTNRKISFLLSCSTSLYILSSSSLPLQLKHKNRGLRRELAEEERNWFNWPAMSIITTKSPGPVLSLCSGETIWGKTFTITSVWKNKVLVMLLTYLALAHHSGKLWVQLWVRAEVEVPQWAWRCVSREDRSSGGAGGRSTGLYQQASSQEWTGRSPLKWKHPLLHSSCSG